MIRSFVLGFIDFQKLRDKSHKTECIVLASVETGCIVSVSTTTFWSIAMAITSQQSAADVITNQHILINEAIHILQAQLNLMPSPEDANWGHVSDASQAADAARSLIKSIQGE